MADTDKFNLISRYNIVLLTLAEKLVDGIFAIIPRKKPDLQSSIPARLIAHRGAFDNKQGIFENTLLAFERAKNAGCWGIELDVHATADNILVVNHDPDLKRLWGKKGTIRQLTFNQLHAMVPQIPTLEEVIKRYGQVLHLFIELKAPFNAGDELAQVLKHLTPCRQYHLLTLEASTFKRLPQFPSSSLLLVAVHNNVKKFCNVSIDENYGGVLANYLLLTTKEINQLLKANQCFGAGFINSRYSLYRELNRGNHWLFTNRTEQVSVHLRNLQRVDKN